MANRHNKTMDALRVLGALFRARVLRARVPLAVSWDVTFRCNLRCQYCASPNVRTPELSGPPALTLVDDLAAMGTRWLTLSGGEPLLRADIGLLADRARNQGMRVRLSTNGLLVPRRIGELQSVETMTISLDGPQGVHDRVRGDGAFAGAMAGVQAARTAGIAVNFMCTLGRHNLATTDELLGLAAQCGAPVMFQPATPWMNLGKEPNPIAPDVTEYRAVMGDLICRKRRGAPILNSVAGMRYLACWPASTRIPCFAGRLFCIVQPDGAILACNLFEDSCLGGKEMLSAPAAERFAHAGRHAVNCRQCWCAPLVELNLMLALHPGPILNAFRMGL